MTNQSPIDAFINHKAQIDAMIERLSALSDDHFDTHPDKITWAEAGTLARIAELLKCTNDFAFGEGE